MRATLRTYDQTAKMFWDMLKTDPVCTILTTLLVCLAFPQAVSVKRGYAYQEEVTIE